LQAWFSNYHAEKLPSAIERYEKEIHRVLGVLEAHLSDGKEWFVGNKYSIVDINNYPWLAAVPWLVGAEVWEKFPRVKAYVDRVSQQKGIKEAYAEKAALAK
jgi:glutathione S-transferase